MSNWQWQWFSQAATSAAQQNAPTADRLRTLQQQANNIRVQIEQMHQVQRAMTSDPFSLFDYLAQPRTRWPTHQNLPAGL